MSVTVRLLSSIQNLMPKKKLKSLQVLDRHIFLKAEFVIDMETGPTSCLTFLIYSSRDELEAEAELHNEYMESVRPHVREVFGYSGSLKYLFN